MRRQEELALPRQVVRALQHQEERGLPRQAVWALQRQSEQDLPHQSVLPLQRHENELFRVNQNDYALSILHYIRALVKYCACPVLLRET